MRALIQSRNRTAQSVALREPLSSETALHSASEIHSYEINELDSRNGVQGSVTTTYLN